MPNGSEIGQWKKREGVNIAHSRYLCDSYQPITAAFVPLDFDSILQLYDRYNKKSVKMEGLSHHSFRSWTVWCVAFYGSEYEGGGVPDPRPDNVGESVRFSIARPKGSLAKLEGGAAVCSPIMVRPKKTSGEVHAATARRM